MIEPMEERMMMNHRVDPPDEDYDHNHDQLPNVEEYKAVMGHRSVKGLPNISFLRKPVDPEGDYRLQAQQDVEEEEIDFTQDNLSEEEEEEHNVFRVHETAPFQTKRSSQSRICKTIACVILPAVIFISIIVAFVLNRFTNHNFIHGDTDSYIVLRDYLTKERRISHADAFNSSTSPQYLAAQWMAHGDDARLQVPTSGQNSTFEERYIMAVVYFSLGGPQWEQQAGFLSGGHICTWYTIHGSRLAVYGLHGCDSDNYYPRNLLLPANGLIGTIPQEIQFLHRIERLNLAFNGGISGTLPPALWKMSSLEQLALQFCNIKGTIPTWIGNMSNLNFLGLGNNQLFGEVPTEIGQLTQLDLLGLDNNFNLGISLERLAPLVNINSLYLDKNYISGSISEDLVAGWPKLQELDMSDCYLTGTVPSNFFAADELQVLDLHANELEGPILPIVEPNSKLEFLALNENALSGILPESLTNLRSIQHLDLSVNAFEFTIPEKFGELTTLKSLNLGTNNFLPGTIPKFLIELTNLRELSLDSSGLMGTIPEYIQYLSNLVFLNFHKNALTGTIPTGFGRLTGMRIVVLKENQLKGALPQELSRLTDLQLFLLEQNKLEGDAQMICEDVIVDTFVADCGGFTSSFDCSCCSTCCKPDDANCNQDWEWTENLDSVWEYGHRRPRYNSQTP